MKRETRTEEEKKGRAEKQEAVSSFSNFSIIRKVLSNLFRCYTLTFDRSAPHDYLSLDILFKKLERARRECAIVCTTPSAIKSLMLKYIDMLNSVMQADRLLLVSSQRKRMKKKEKRRNKKKEKKCTPPSAIMKKISTFSRNSFCPFSFFV